MTFSAELLLQKLRDLEDDRVPHRYLVAFSGGLDSTVLLHALVQSRHPTREVTAVHVDHGLHPDSPAWERHCRRIAADFGVDYLSRRVTIRKGTADGSGLEAAAREARYAALRDLMQPGDALLSAHHQEDQAETVLLNLMRGSGLAGLAGIGAAQAFGAGILLRPLLDFSRRELERYAADRGLEWIVDPANAELRFDRNYLRREILPRLRERWPAAAERLKRSAELAAEAAGLQEELAALDLARLGTVDRLDAAGLQRLSLARQRNVLRYAIRLCGLPGAPSTRLQQAVTELIPARADAQPLVRWRGGELRRYRGRVYLLREMPTSVPAEPLTLTPDRELCLGSGLGALQLEADVANGLDPRLVAAGIEIRFRAGGERIRPAGRSGTRSVKKLLQEAGVVPWMRNHVPLLYAGKTLIGVADLWLAADATSERGYAPRWLHKPSIL